MGYIYHLLYKYVKYFLEEFQMNKIGWIIVLVVLLSSFGLFTLNLETKAQEPVPEFVDPVILEPQTEGEESEAQIQQTTEDIIDQQVVEAPERSEIKAEVLSIDTAACADEIDTDTKSCYEVKVKLLEGDNEDQEETLVVDSRADALIDEWELEQGDEVVVVEFDFGDTKDYQLLEIYRASKILWFVALYVLVVLVVARWQGLGSLIGLALSVFVILQITIPMTLNGYDPVLIALIGGFAVLVPSIYFSHGLNTKTSIALIGTSIGLIVTGILAVVAIEVTTLTGFGAEESLYLATSDSADFNMRSILLASMIIGGIGLIDDVTVGQVAVIKEILEENQTIKLQRLYSKAMNVGKDHIASMVNTLFLAYTAASLPLLMLLVDKGASLSDVANIETFAEEIIRTLVASTGLVLTLPITTLIASYYYINFRKK